MRRLARWLIAAALLIVGLAIPSQTMAFPLSPPCTLSLESRDASGAPIATAQSGAGDATRSQPFDVEWDGSVFYNGSTGAVIKNYTYQVSVFGLPTPIRGSGTNDEENTTGTNSLGVGVNSPFGRVAGLYHVSGTYVGEGGSCAGSGWFRLLGDPVGTLPWILGLALIVLGTLGLYGGARGHALTSVLGGFVAGVGVALLAVSYSVVPFDERTPILLIALLTGIGVIIAFLGRRARREPPPPEPATA